MSFRDGPLERRNELISLKVDKIQLERRMNLHVQLEYQIHGVTPLQRLRHCHYLLLIFCLHKMRAILSVRLPVYKHPIVLHRVDHPDVCFVLPELVVIQDLYFLNVYVQFMLRLLEFVE